MPPAQAQQELILLMGPPTTAKRLRAQSLIKAGYTHIIAGASGERHGDVPSRLRRALRDGAQRIVVDHTVPARRNRTWIIDLAHKNTLSVRAILVEADLHLAMVDACQHMIDVHGRLLEPTELQADDSLISPARLEAWFAEFEMPSEGEGLKSVAVEQAAPRRFDRPESRPGLLLDLDGTIRGSRGRTPFPRTGADVVLLPNRTERLSLFVQAGFTLAGVSNQGGVGLGQISQQGMREALDKTVELLGLPFDARACPHDPRAGCWCRKPRPGLALQQMHDHQLDPTRTWMIGDRHPDEGLAAGLGVPYIDARVFFAEDGPTPEALLAQAAQPQ